MMLALQAGPRRLPREAREKSKSSPVHRARNTARISGTSSPLSNERLSPLAPSPLHLTECRRAHSKDGRDALSMAPSGWQGVSSDVVAGDRLCLVCQFMFTTCCESGRNLHGRRPDTSSSCPVDRSHGARRHRGITPKRGHLGSLKRHIYVGPGSKKMDLAPGFGAPPARWPQLDERKQHASFTPLTYSSFQRRYGPHQALV